MPGQRLSHSAFGQRLEVIKVLTRAGLSGVEIVQDPGQVAADHQQ